MRVTFFQHSSCNDVMMYFHLIDAMKMKNCLNIMETQTQWDCSTLWHHLTKMVELIEKRIGSKGFEPVAFTPFKQCPYQRRKGALVN